jgi:protein TonB
MKSVLILILLLLFTTSYSQKVKKVVVDDYQLFCRHEYYVLKKEKSVKHGAFKSTWVNGNPREEGFYKMGLKDSSWTYFNPFKPFIAKRGRYEEGKKVGIWEYFDDKEVIMHRYDHSKRYLSYSTFKDTIFQHSVRTNDTTINAKLQRPPIFLPGESAKFRVIQNNIHYPTKAIDLNIYGTVMIAFYINLEGQAIEHEIIKKIGGGCDEEALRVVKLIPNEWIPGIYNNKEVEVRVIVPITFQLN